MGSHCALKEVMESRQKDNVDPVIAIVDISYIAIVTGVNYDARAFLIQNVRHLQHVIRKPDGGKSCQGRAIKVNARESYD